MTGARRLIAAAKATVLRALAARLLAKASQAEARARPDPGG